MSFLPISITNLEVATLDVQSTSSAISVDVSTNRINIRDNYWAWRGNYLGDYLEFWCSNPIDIGILMTNVEKFGRQWFRSYMEKAGSFEPRLLIPDILIEHINSHIDSWTRDKKIDEIIDGNK